MSKRDPFKPVNLHAHTALVEAIKTEDERRGETRFMFSAWGIIVLPFVIIGCLVFAIYSFFR